MKKRKKREDENQSAARVVAISTGQPIPITKKKNPAAVALGLLGGSKGGKIRAANLSPERRREIASAAARTMWARRKKKS